MPELGTHSRLALTHCAHTGRSSLHFNYAAGLALVISLDWYLHEGV